MPHAILGMLCARPISPVGPIGAYDFKLGEFILLYEDACSASDPAQATLDSLQSSYAAAASAHWDRMALERSPASTSTRPGNA